MEPNQDLVSSEEMSALLPPVQADDPSRDKRRKVVAYNFRRPDRLSKDQVSSLYLLHDLFAHTLSSSLPLFMRSASEVNLISVEQQSYGDYLKGLSDPTTIFTVSASSLRGVFAIEMNCSIAFPVIDRMLGGDGLESSDVRPATELEMKVLEGFLTVVIDSYREAWGTIVEFEAEIMGRETRPQLMQIVPANEIVATVVYQLQVGESKGLMSICLPVVMLEPVIDKFNKSSYSSEDSTPPEATNSLLKRICGVRFPVSIELETVPASLADLMTLSTGDVLRTNHSVDRPINVSVGESVKFVGRLAALDGKMVAQLIDHNDKKVQSAA